jgi:hypothetical protein
MKFEVYNCTTREQQMAISRAVYQAMRSRGFVDGCWSWSIDIDWIPLEPQEARSIADFPPFLDDV